MTSSIDLAALELVACMPGVLRALLAGLPRELLAAPNAEGWSLTDIVAPLVDVEGVAFVERITRMLDEDQPVFHSIDPPARLIAGGYAARGLEELLAATDGELETVDGVGEIRAKDIREGLRRQQEINLVDRYLQT